MSPQFGVVMLSGYFWDIKERREMNVVLSRATELSVLVGWFVRRRVEPEWVQSAGRFSFLTQTEDWGVTSTPVPGRGAGGASVRAGGGQKYLVWSEGAEWLEPRVLLLHTTVWQNYAKTWRPGGRDPSATRLGLLQRLRQQALLYRPQQSENYLDRPQRQVTRESEFDLHIPSCFID